MKNKMHWKFIKYQNIMWHSVSKQELRCKNCRIESNTGMNSVYVKRLSRQITYGFYVCLLWRLFVCHGYIWYNWKYGYKEHIMSKSYTIIFYLTAMLMYNVFGITMKMEKLMNWLEYIQKRVKRETYHLVILNMRVQNSLR